MQKVSYECLTSDCGRKFDSLTGIKHHLRRTHKIHPAKEGKDYRADKQAANNNFQCLFKLSNGECCNKVFSTPQGITAHILHGHKVKEVDKSMYRVTEQTVPQKKQPRPYKRRQSTKPAANIETQFGQPVIDNGFILLPVTLRIPFSLGIPQIIQDEQE